MTKEKLLTAAINTYGHMPQKLMAIEEMSELAKEICKDFRGNNNRDKISEEMADVEIMLAQLKLIYSNHGSVRKWTNIKLRRLAQRLGVAYDD